MIAATETLATRIRLTISAACRIAPQARDNDVGLGYNREPIHAAQALCIEPRALVGLRFRCA
jgi:hypothetical protein